VASQFNDPGMNWLYYNLSSARRQVWRVWICRRADRAHPLTKPSSSPRHRYLADIVHACAAIASVPRPGRGREPRLRAVEEPRGAGRYAAAPARPTRRRRCSRRTNTTRILVLRLALERVVEELEPRRASCSRTGRRWSRVPRETVLRVRGRKIEVSNYSETLSHSSCKVASPLLDWGDILKWRGSRTSRLLPYTAGVYPYRRSGEDPAAFAARPAERTNRRFTT